MEAVQFLVLAFYLYLLVGAAFATYYVLRAIDRLDEAARGVSWKVRALLWPGSLLLWPVLLRKWWLARPKPTTTP